MFWPFNWANLFVRCLICICVSQFEHDFLKKNKHFQRISRFWMSRHRNPKTHNERTFAKTNAISCKSARFNWTFERALKLASSSFSPIEHICFESSKVQSEPVGGKECSFEGPRLRHREIPVFSTISCYIAIPWVKSPLAAPQQKKHSAFSIATQSWVHHQDLRGLFICRSVGEFLGLYYAWWL